MSEMTVLGTYAAAKNDKGDLVFTQNVTTDIGQGTERMLVLHMNIKRKFQRNGKNFEEPFVQKETQAHLDIIGAIERGMLDKVTLGVIPEGIMARPSATGSITHWVHIHIYRKAQVSEGTQHKDRWLPAFQLHNARLMGGDNSVLREGSNWYQATKTNEPGWEWSVTFREKLMPLLAQRIQPKK